MLWEVLIRSWALEGLEDLCLATGEWSSSEDDTYLDLDLCLPLSECFLGLGWIRGSSESSSSWSEAELGVTVCLWLCFLCEYKVSFGIASEGATYWSEEVWLSTSRGGSAGPTSTSIASDCALVLDLGGGRSRWAAELLDGPAFEAWGEGSTSAGFLTANSSRSDWNASNMDAWKEPICCWICIFKESPRDFSRFLWILFCKTVPGVGGTALAGGL